MTEVKNADALRKMVREYEASEEKRIEKEVNEIVTKIIEEYLVPKAQKGGTEDFIHCYKYRDEIFEVLCNKGFNCEFYDNIIRITW